MEPPQSNDQEHDRIRVGQLRKFRARLRIFSRDRFVPEIKADVVRAGFADDTREDAGGDLEIEVGIFFRVADVVQHAGAGTAFHPCPFRVHRKSRSAARNNCIHWQASVAQFVSKLLNLCKCLVGVPVALRADPRATLIEPHDGRIVNALRRRKDTPIFTFLPATSLISPAAPRQ